MECYIVRIYRRDGSFSTEPVGFVELPEDGRKLAFHGIPELLAILQNNKQPRTRARKRRKSTAHR